MKTDKRAITGIIAAVGILAVGSAWAGDLTPPGAPKPTMHTLEEIYQELLTTKQQVANLESRLNADGKYVTSGGMVLIPAGSFSMGDAFDPEGFTDELPVHTVSVSAFYMDKTEVTKAKWEKAARGGASGWRFPWEDANTIQHARANYSAASSSSYRYDTSPTTAHHPDYDEGGYPYTSPVGSFAPNGYGLYDMAGNLYEWCWDWYVGAYYASSPGTDPGGPASGSGRVARGGGWPGGAYDCRVAHRLDYLPGSEGFMLGFRLVRAAQ